MKDLTLYCNCFPGHLNRDTQFNQKNLICNAQSLTLIDRRNLEDNSFCFDDDGHNISYLNHWLGDLTGLYWIWKNADDEIVGTNQYRRFWVNEAVNDIQFKEDTLYVANPYNFGDMSAMDQFIKYHGTIGLDILYEAAMKGTISIKPEMIHTLARVGCLSGCNMFFGSRKVFNKTCEILFDIVFELYGGTKYALPHIQAPGQHRLLAFLAERILNIIYLNKNHFYDKLEVVPVPFKLVE